MNEALADISSHEMDLDSEFADSIDDQLAALEMEVVSSTHGSLPEAGTKTATPSKAETEEESTDDLKAMLNEMNTELDSDK